MKTLFKVEAVKSGYVALRVYIEAKSEQEALDSAKIQNNIKRAKWRVEVA